MYVYYRPARRDPSSQTYSHRDWWLYSMRCLSLCFSCSLCIVPCHWCLAVVSFTLKIAKGPLVKFLNIPITKQLVRALGYNQDNDCCFIPENQAVICSYAMDLLSWVSWSSCYVLDSLGYHRNWYSLRNSRYRAFSWLLQKWWFWCKTDERRTLMAY